MVKRDDKDWRQHVIDTLPRMEGVQHRLCVPRI